jgi:hypothetical protein
MKPSRGRPVRRSVGKAAVTAAVLALGLVGCSDPEEGYCETLAAEQEELTELAERDSGRDSGDVLSPTAASFQRLQEAAPEELRDEWDTVVGAYQVLTETIDDLGVDPEGYDPEDPPADLSDGDVRRLATAAGALGSSRVVDAVRGIEDHARAVCDVDFSA